jgi:hypothetical protein
MDAKFTKSRILNAEPNFIIPYVEKELPTLEKFLSENPDPQLI